MKIEHSFEVGAPIERLYAVLNDVDEIGQCIAGVKQVVAVSDTESRWKIEARAGFMARVFDISGTITERRPPTYLAFRGAGQDVTISGFVGLERLDALVTRCDAVVEAEISGALAPLVDLMARGPQQALIEQTIANLRRRLDVEAGVTQGAPVASPAAPPASWWARLRRWVATVFGRDKPAIDSGKRSLK